MRKVRKIMALAAACAMIGTMSIVASAADTAYNVSSLTHKVTTVNDTSSTSTLHVNTRPSTGFGGAHVEIRKSNGTFITSKDFPFYVSVSDLTTSVPSGEARRIYVGPAVSGQTVIGNLHYYFG